MKTLCAVCLLLTLSGCATISQARPQAASTTNAVQVPTTASLKPMIYQFIISEGGRLTEIYEDSEENLDKLLVREQNQGFIQPPVITSARLNPRYQTK